MGGRGSSSGGTSNWRSRLPKVQTPIDMDNLPPLTGSEKQIKWANDIRDELIEKLGYKMYKTESGNPTKALDYIFSKNDMEKYVKSAIEVFSDAPDFSIKLNNRVTALRTATEQMTRLKNLIQEETSAKFWIDHRNTHILDPVWRKLQERVVGYYEGRKKG